MQDSWQSGDPNEYFMGRWSKLIAEQFVDWLSPKSCLQWLDVGCGSGALSEAFINRHDPQEVVPFDQSEGFVRTAQQRLVNKAHCIVGSAMALPLEVAFMNIAISRLVLNFLPEPEHALAEMRRVIRKDGTVAVYIWDYAGRTKFLNCF